MQRNIIISAFLALALQAVAVEVETTAGQLSADLNETTDTSLTIRGTLDARDFKFIAEAMPQLTELDLSQADIVAFSDPTGSLISSVTNYPARTLPHAMLTGMGLTQVVLPANLEGIGQAALAGCKQLTSIELPTGLTTLGAYAFNNTGLTSISVPATIATIGEGVFSNCNALETAVINNAIISNDEFKGDALLSNVTIGNEVTTIGDAAFSGCTSLAGITLGDACGITTIGQEAFAGSGLNTIDLEAMTHLSSIGAWAFTGAPLQVIQVPESVTDIGAGAFFYMPQLAEASIPGLTKVNNYTFTGNDMLTSPEVLAEGTERIGDYAFYGASGFQTFVLPSTIAYIGDKAMAGMTGLTQLDVLGDVAALGDNVWEGIDQPQVNLDTRRSNEISLTFAQAEQWQNFHILLDYLLGDANDDARVNVLDITTTVDYIQKDYPEVFVFPAADVEGDNTINVLDITGMVDIILDKTYSTIRAIRGIDTTNGMNVTDDELVISDMHIWPGRTETVAIGLNNNTAYNAMECDVTLSEGLELADEIVGLTERTQNHVTAIRQQPNGSYRIVLFSLDNQEIVGSEGNIFTLNVKATDEVSSNSHIEISRVVYADHNYDYLGNSAIAYVHNVVTGVDDVHNMTSKVWGEAGRLFIETPAEGMAQIVTASGIAKTVNVKPGINEFSVEPGIYMIRINGTSHKVVVF
ncbi:MAG: leucine-rich repeat protein [Muribaculaceae bacterium]|nr:leucine-rich repeat protein [Muribaculaceae bacterium]